ncbi:MAG: helix-turn-helix transcriptional regulator [Clostridiales bacterium]|nr:helix-turn-helix transcriptional regulator [Clostridiales bacterium]
MLLLMASVNVNYRIIGLHVSTFRHQQRLTQEQLTEKAGISKQFLGNIECGKAIPSVQTVLSLCDALDVTPDDLLNHSAVHDPDAPCTLRDDANVFPDTITSRLFPQEQSVHISLDDLPAFDITLPDPNEQD